LDILGVTKQSLNRVLRQLVIDKLVDSKIGKKDRRERNLQLTQEGQELERRLSEAQRKRMRAAYKAAGPDAVQGFRTVLQNIMDPQMKIHLD
jgi:DNA-binding MarR family transcriptional regulator